MPGSRPARGIGSAAVRGRGQPDVAADRSAPWLSIVVPLKNEAENIDFVTEAIVAACAPLAPLRDRLRRRRLRPTTPPPASSRSPGAFPRSASSGTPTSAGQSAAVHSGVTLARGSAICTLDGDGQNPPSEIPKLVARLDGRSFPDGVGARRRPARRPPGHRLEAPRLARRQRPSASASSTTTPATPAAASSSSAATSSSACPTSTTCTATCPRSSPATAGRRCTRTSPTPRATPAARTIPTSPARSSAPTISSASCGSSSAARRRAGVEVTPEAACAREA